MPAIEVSGCLGYAALWNFAGPDYRGEPLVDEPVEIRVRFEKNISQLIDLQEGSVAVTGTLMVDRPIATGSIIRIGKLEDVPDPPNHLLEVIDYDEIPDVKAREVQRNVVVRRWGKNLPLA